MLLSLEATRAWRREVTSIWIRLCFFKVDDYGTLGRALLEDMGSFTTRSRTQVTVEEEAAELLRGYSKTDLSKYSMVVT